MAVPLPHPLPGFFVSVHSKWFKVLCFGSADSKGVTGGFFVSADSKGDSGE